MNSKTRYMRVLKYSLMLQMALLAVYVAVIISENGLSLKIDHIEGFVFIVIACVASDIMIVREFNDTVRYLRNYKGDYEELIKKKEEHDIYEHLAEISMDISYEYDIDKEIMYIYGNYKELLPRKVHDKIPNFGKFIREAGVFYKPHVPSIIDAFYNFPEGENINQVDCLVANHNNEYEWFTLTMAHHPQDNHKIIGFIRNINKHVTLIEELRMKSHTDSLTKLFNKESTINYINEALCDVSDKNIGCFVLIDIDDFKKYNDVYGHLVGDHVISECANLIRKNFQEEDIVGRIGGDEFVIFMKGIKKRSAVEERIAKLMKAVENIDCSSLGVEKNHAVTLSIGLFECLEPSTYDELCEKADKAMYNMKAEGKNSFAWYDENMTLPLILKKRGQKTNFNKIMYDLFHMKVQSKTTKDILMYIIKTFGINQIAVYKVDNKEETLIPVENGSMKGTPVIIPKFKTLLELPYDEQGLFYRNHYKDELSEPCTFMCLKIEKNDELVGYITFKDDNPSYYWTNEEIQSIAILAYYICDDLYISERA